MSFSAELDMLHSEVFETLGVQCVFSPRDGDDITTRVVFDEVTHTVGELGGMIDPRPSVSLPVTAVGRKPRGIVTLGTRRLEIDCNVDSDNDAYMVRVYVRETEGI